MFLKAGSWNSFRMIPVKKRQWDCEICHPVLDSKSQKYFWATDNYSQALAFAEDELQTGLVTDSSATTKSNKLESNAFEGGTTIRKPP